MHVCVSVVNLLEGHAPPEMTMLSKAVTQGGEEPFWASNTIYNHIKKDLFFHSQDQDKTAKNESWTINNISFIGFGLNVQIS